MRRPTELIIHGLGCPKTGGKVVLQNLILQLRDYYKCTVLVSSAASDVLDCKAKYKVFSERLLNGFFRPCVELVLGLCFGPHRRQAVLNLSNYGINYGGSQLLLIHSPEILHAYFSKQSLGNWLKVYMLRWSLGSASAVILQTKHMERDLTRFCLDNAVRLPPVITCRPDLPSRMAAHSPLDSFKLFYPASPFAHKRIDLCENAADDPRVADCIFYVTNSAKKTENFFGLLPMTHSEVLNRMSSCHALIFTSEAETLGLPLLEALSYALPAVLPRLPYAIELYDDAAVYFDSFDAVSVASAIVELRANYIHYQQRASARAKVLNLDNARNRTLLQDALHGLPCPVL